MGKGITPIFDTEVERVKEQLAQADALRKMGLEGNTGSGYQGGRVFVVGNPLGNIASGLAGAFLGDRARTRQGELEQQQTTARDEWLGQMPTGVDTQHYDPVANPGTGPLAEGMEVPQSPLQQAKAMQSWAMKAPRGMEGVQNFALQQSLTAPQREAEAAQKAQDRLHELQMKAIDARATQAERLAAQKEIAQMQIEGRKETARLVASLKASGSGKGAGEVDPAAADLIAARFIEGDKNALMGISRNAALHGAVMASIARQAKEQGVDAKELVMRGLEYGGASAEQRTVGTQAANVQMAANEANKMIDVSLDLSKSIPRTEFPSMNAAGNIVRKQSGDPNVVAFNQSIDSLINGYARAINPKGVATVADKKRAHETLSAAFSTGQFEATTQVMRREMDAALAAPKTARAQAREARVGGGEAKPDQNADARAWLAANPNDPRAAAVRAKLEGK